MGENSGKNRGKFGKRRGKLQENFEEILGEVGKILGKIWERGEILAKIWEEGRQIWEKGAKFWEKFGVKEGENSRKNTGKGGEIPGKIQDYLGLIPNSHPRDPKVGIPDFPSPAAPGTPPDPGTWSRWGWKIPKKSQKIQGGPGIPTGIPSRGLILFFFRDWVRKSPKSSAPRRIVSPGSPATR